MQAALLSSLAADNLVPNGGFEQSPPEEGIPAEWKKSVFSAEGVSVVSEARPDSPGKFCLQIKNDPENIQARGIFSELLPVDPQKPLAVSAWIKAGGPSPQSAGVYLGVAWYDPERAPVPFLSDDPKRNYTYVSGDGTANRWIELQSVFAPADEASMARQRFIPPTAAFFEIRIFTLNYPLTVQVDDVTATQTP